MDYRDAYYANDWGRMYKVFKLKYMKVKSFIMKHWSEEERNILEDDTTIRTSLKQLKDSNTDFATKWNNNIVFSLLEAVEIKMLLIDKLMSTAGMNILMEPATEDKPAALATDDF